MTRVQTCALPIYLRKLEEEGEITEDDLKRFEDDIQKLTDATIKTIDQLLALKEKEITTV